MTATPAPAAAPALPLSRKISTLLDLIKFAHTVFALPFALLAAFLAFRVTGLSLAAPGLWGRLGLIVLCMVFARTFAMTVNRLVDREFDAQNPRAARRPSVTGVVSPSFMRLVIMVCALGFLAGAAGFYIAFGNLWPLLLAVPVLVWLASYSFTKRFTALCHFWLGAALGLAPVSAWIALVPPHGPVLTPAIVFLGAAVLFWVAGFDILYSMQDEAIDRTAELHSIPAAVGRPAALWISRACHLLTVLALLGFGLAAGLHVLYWVGFAVAAVLLIVEQSLVTPRDISRVNIAFMTVNGAVGVIFGLLVIADVWLF
jgi:4-hydroxybenzoate polyprenyltransferase